MLIMCTHCHLGHFSFTYHQPCHPAHIFPLLINHKSVNTPLGHEVSKQKHTDIASPQCRQSRAQSTRLRKRNITFCAACRWQNISFVLPTHGPCCDCSGASRPQACRTARQQGPSSAYSLCFITSLVTAVQTESVNTWQVCFFPGHKKGTKAGEYGFQFIQMKIE